jgi:hypothetical protein
VLRDKVEDFIANRANPPELHELLSECLDDGSLEGLACVRRLYEDMYGGIAAASRGLAKIPVMIVEARDVERRGKAFVAHNTNRLNVTPIQLWHSRLAAGDVNIRAAASACRAAGVTPVRSQPGNGRWRPGETVAFGAIERLLSRRSRDDAIRVLKTLAAAKRAPVMAHEILAAEAVLYDEQLGYDGPVFDLVVPAGIFAISPLRAHLLPKRSRRVAGSRSSRSRTSSRSLSRRVKKNRR